MMQSLSRFLLLTVCLLHLVEVLGANVDGDVTHVECATPGNLEIPEGLCVMDGVGGYSEACYSYKQPLPNANKVLHSDSFECLGGADFDAIRSALQLDKASKQTYVPTIEINEWSTIFRILLEEMLGFRILRVFYHSESTSFHLRAEDESCQAINLELWQKIPSSESEVITQPLGVVGRKGIYVPKSTPVSSSHFQLLHDSLISSNPQSSSPYNFFPPSGDLNLTDLFKDREKYACNDHTPSTVGWTESTCMDGSWIPPQCAENTDCKELYLDHPKSSLGWFEAVVKNLGLKFHVVYLGLQGLLRRVEEMHLEAAEGSTKIEEMKGIAYYWWEPHPLHVQYASRRLIIPDFSEQCKSTYSVEPMDSGVNCDSEPRSLLKAIPAGLKNSQPDLYALWSSFSLDNAEQMEMMMLEGPWMGGGGNLTIEEAACEWLRTTNVNWSHWISVTIPSIPSEGSTKSAFSLLEITLFTLLMLFVLIGGWVIFRNLYVHFQTRSVKPRRSFQNFESPIEKTIALLSDMLQGKKIPKENIAHLKNTLQFHGDHVNTPEWHEQLLGSENDYSKEGILYVLDMQMDRKPSGKTAFSNESNGDSSSKSDPQDTDVVERNKSNFHWARNVQETLRDPTLPWTWNFANQTDWDFFGAFKNEADAIEKDEAILNMEGEITLAIDSPTKKCQAEFSIGQDLNFNTVDAVPSFQEKPLVTIGMFLIDEQFNLVNRLGLDPNRVWNFLVEVENGYLSSNPYHNNTHAADVTHRFATFLTLCRLRVSLLSDLEVLAGLIAAILHDYLHPGTNNAFQVNAGAPVAILHNNSHVLENHSAMRGLLLLKGEHADQLLVHSASNPTTNGPGHCH